MGKNADYYKILGVSKSATQEEIKKAYRKLARKWHPDINPGNSESEERFKDISMAFDTLGNPERRKLYDEFGEEGLAQGFDAEKARQYKAWQSSTRAGSGGFRASAGGFGFDDLFGKRQYGQYHQYEDVFQDLFTGGKQGFAQRPRSRGRDIEHTMEVDFMSSLRGIETLLSMEKLETCPNCGGSGSDPNVELKICPSCKGSGRISVAEGPIPFSRPCPECQGQGRVGRPCPVCYGEGRKQVTATIKVSIPRGVRDGFRVRVAGKGEPGSSGGPPGDLYLIIRVKPHPLLTRKGDDLIYGLPVTVEETLAGGSIVVPTPDGSVSLKIPPGSQSGKLLRLKGKGAENPKTKKSGDLLVKLDVRVPETSDQEAVEAAKVLSRFYSENPRANLRF
ncbi:MAG: J domain-containing protein [Deltaproteobacteria bacterium]|nr:J domain-containing protein [Deltaproteobacteria bacterium]